VKDARVLWEIGVWMHIGVGIDVSLEAWDNHQEEGVPDLKAFEHSFVADGVLRK
jgi:hypothetical protein